MRGSLWGALQIAWTICSGTILRLWALVGRMGSQNDVESSLLMQSFAIPRPQMVMTTMGHQIGDSMLDD